MKLRMGFILLVFLLLTGCATTQNYEAQVQKWIGATELQVVQDWGVPTGSYDVQGIRFLEYRSTETRLIGGSPFFFGGPPPHVGKIILFNPISIGKGRCNQSDISRK